MFSIGLAYLFHWNGEGLDLQWAFLLVFVIYLLVAALLGYLGYRKVQKVRRPREGDRRGPEDQGRADHPRRLTGRLAQLAQSWVSTASWPTTPSVAASDSCEAVRA